MKKLQKLLSLTAAMMMPFGIFGCAEAAKPIPDPDPGVENISIEHSGRAIDATVYRPDATHFPVVVFSHGFNGYKDDFRDTAELLMQNGIGSITFTFCGSGTRDTSGMSTTEMTLYTERDDLSAVMDYARAMPWFDGTLVLFGGSQGGMVSAMAAQERMDDVAALMLIFPAFNIPDDWNSRYPTEESIPDSANVWGVTLGKNFFLTLRDLNIYTPMPEFTKPVRIFHGTADTIVPIRYSERASTTYPSATLTTLAGEGHGFSAAGMQQVNRALLTLMQEL